MKIKTKFVKFIKNKLRSKFTFDQTIAKRLTDTSYYKAQARNMKQYEFLEQEKKKLKTRPWYKISELIEKYVDLANNEKSGTGRVLLGIYNKNEYLISKKEPINNSNLISIISKPETLLIAYREIRGNKGALTPAASVSRENYNAMDEKQKILYLKSLTLPDNISLYDIELACQLIKTGKYPWGSSSRLYFDKPGQPGKRRPITIPSFLDKMIQKAIELVLQSIYEPEFEKLNRSFGFRPNKGTHDAMIAITSRYTNGMKTALEGDIEAAYDTVDRDILLDILGEKIQDRKFLNLIKDRLNYDFVDQNTNSRMRPTIGIPQGGIDSPYLFNIYMSKLDDFIHNELQTYVDKLNDKLRIPKSINKTGFKRIINPDFNKKRFDKNLILRAQKWFKNKLQEETSPFKINYFRKQLFKLIKDNKMVTHKKNYIFSGINNKRELRIFYVRYADDWILLTNGDKQVTETLKRKIKNFLETKLKLKLSENKTLITNITKDFAKFLGFEIKVSARGPLRKEKIRSSIILKDNGIIYKKWNLQKISGLLVWCQPDRQRLLSKYHMKGLCDTTGFPISIPWVSILEAHAIIERYNSCIRGCANYYLNCIRNRAKINQWIYILRFSCMKTIAQKYKLSLKKVFKRFGTNLHSKSDQTISVKVEQQVGDEIYYRSWKLLTYKDLVTDIPYKKSRTLLEKRFWDVEKGKYGNYPLKNKIPKVTNQDYLDAISWSSWRTTAAFDMPCAYCGSEENIEQHHIKHIRKRAYSLIPDAKSYQKIMSLRNRKQIPLCHKCHMFLVHGGRYNGPKLTNESSTHY